jgi:hypothetical protein
MNITLRNFAVDKLSPLLVEVRKTPAPDPHANRGIALDGVSQSLFVAGAFGEQVNRWNTIAVPQGWEQMIAWVERLLVVLDTASAG